MGSLAAAVRPIRTGRGTRSGGGDSAHPEGHRPLQGAFSRGRSRPALAALAPGAAAGQIHPLASKPWPATGRRRESWKGPSHCTKRPLKWTISPRSSISQPHDLPSAARPAGKGYRGVQRCRSVMEPDSARNRPPRPRALFAKLRSGR